MLSFSEGNVVRWVRLFALFTVVLAIVNCCPALAQEVNAPEPVDDVNFLYWIAKVSGIIGLLLFLVSIYFVTVVIQNFLVLRMSVAAPPEVISACQAAIENKNVNQLMETVSQDDSYFSQILFAGLSDLGFGLDEARDKLERTAEALNARMEANISILAVLGTLGPMIGLLGTLKGMITAFSAIAISGVSLDAAKVAEAISEALVLTFEGVLLSIPAIYLYSLFRNRIATITIETTTLADDQLRSASTLMRRKPDAK
jgi:biopolymer transport protein ExbB